MGNECPSCETPIADCKMRDVFKQQPKNRSDLDLSSIKKGEYKRKNKSHQHQDSDQSESPDIIVIQSSVVDRGSKKVEPSSIKKTKSQLVNSSAQAIKKPLSLDTGAQTIEIKKGVKYIGGTVDRQPHEKGKVIWEDGSTMLAQFFLGSMAENQKVSFKTHSDVTYEGQVYEGKANFKGILTLPDGSSYDGEWKDDLPHGYGKHKIEDGSFYEGQFINGLKSGKGKYYFDNGMYEGTFANDMFQGQGIMILNDGRTIKGHWQNGVLEGKGEIDWTSGQKYTGSFSNNCREGEGTYLFSDGRQWTGEWSNDLQNGFGSYLLPSGQTVKGIWVQGVKKDEMREIEGSKVRRP